MLESTWHYAVVVGIDQYPKIENGELNLRCPIKDAERMHEWLTARQGGNIPSERAVLLTRTMPPDRRPPAPIFDEINSAILDAAADFVKRRKKMLPTEVARRAAWQKSRFYFYLSGHGMDGEGDDAALITANATTDSLNHISTRQVLNRLKQEHVYAEIVIFADCCRELAAVPVQVLPWNLSKYAGFNDPRLPKIFVALASRNRTSAFEPPESSPIKNSLFTQGLIEGLEGGVPGNSVNSGNLKRFLLARVPQLAQMTAKPDQYPELLGDDDIEFGSTSKSYQVTLTAQTNSAFAGMPAVDAVEMIGGVVRTRVTFPAGAGRRFEGKLPTGYYAIVPSGTDPLQSTAVHALRVLGEDVNEHI
jgi:uncharacterized caspase-like protein